MSGSIKIDGSGGVEFKEEDGIDYAAVTVQLPGGERVPFLFSIKNLAAKVRVLPAGALIWGEGRGLLAAAAAMAAASIASLQFASLQRPAQGDRAACLRTGAGARA